MDSDDVCKNMTNFTWEVEYSQNNASKDFMNEKI